MKKLFIIPLFCFALLACNTNQNELDQQQDDGIEGDRDYEAASDDTTVTNEVNVTGNAKSGPVEGP